MNLLKSQFTIPKSKRKRFIISLVLFFSIFLVFFLGYFTGKYERGLPFYDFSDKVEKTFIYSYENGDNILEIENTIKYPHSWKFESSQENQNFQLYSDDNKMVITITPRRVDFSSKVLSTQLYFRQEITPKCIGTQKVHYLDGIKEISTYRIEQGDLSFKYIQKITTKSPTSNETERFYLLDYFVVFNTDKIENQEDSIIWIAEITAEFDGVESEINNYIVAADEIVASLQIKGDPFTASNIMVGEKIVKGLSSLFQK